MADSLIYSHHKEIKLLWQVKSNRLQSEAGAAGAVHGALQAGLSDNIYRVTRFTFNGANIYKWVGELLPAVLHVSARSIAARSLSIFGDHQDIYAVRQTGDDDCKSQCPEVADLAPALNSTWIKCSVLHFFDGLTSHEIQKVEVIDENE